MKRHINLSDNQIAIAIGNTDIIMNINTAFDVGIMEKVLGSCDCTKTKEQYIQGINKAAKGLTSNTVVNNDAANVIVLDKKPSNSSTKNDNDSDVKPVNTPGKKKERIPVVVYEFDPERASRWNDLRAGIGKFVKRFDSMIDAEYYYGIASGTISRVVNTWLPYMWHTGKMNPMIGDVKNYRFSSKYNGKTLLWKFTPYLNYNTNGIKRLVAFRADAVPQFIKDREFN